MEMLLVWLCPNLSVAQRACWQRDIIKLRELSPQQRFRKIHSSKGGYATWTKRVNPTKPFKDGGIKYKPPYIMGTDCANKAGITGRYIAWIANSAPRPSIPYMLAKFNGKGRHA